MNIPKLMTWIIWGDTGDWIDPAFKEERWDDRTNQPLPPPVYGQAEKKFQEILNQAVKQSKKHV